MLNCFINYQYVSIVFAIIIGVALQEYKKIQQSDYFNATLIVVT